MSATSVTNVSAAFSRSNYETEPTCARAERNTRTASNDADIRPSLVRLGAQTGHKGGHFALFSGDCRNSQTRWRRGGDLNPRNPSEFTRYARCLIMLTHKSSISSY